MNVWIKRCRKQASCKYCPHPILNDSYMVVCKWYRRTVVGGVQQKWSFNMKFHTQCWIDQGVAELEKRPVTETRGRKKTELTDSDRAARLKILMRRAAVIQRIKREMAKPDQDMNRIVHLGSALGKLKEEIEPLGGIPASWE